MRRLLAITAFGLFLALPVWAQHGGGGHFGGGGHAGFSGGHAGGFAGHTSFNGPRFSGGSHISSAYGAHAYSGARSYSGMRAEPGFSHRFTPLPTGAGISHSPYLHDGFHNGVGLRLRTYGFRNGCRGWGCRGGYAWGYPSLGWGWGYDPWLWGNWDYDDAGFDNAYQQDLADANAMNEQSLQQQQMQEQQTEEQQTFDQEEADGDQDVYARPPYRPRYDAPQSRSNPASNEATAIIPPTLLVFRDQRKEEVSNYAIVGQTLWNFAPQHTEKIPLSELDLPATTKANDDRGVTFRVPLPGEGQ